MARARVELPTSLLSLMCPALVLAALVAINSMVMALFDRFDWGRLIVPAAFLVIYLVRLNVGRGRAGHAQMDSDPSWSELEPAEVAALLRSVAPGTVFIKTDRSLVDHLERTRAGERIADDQPNA